LAVVDTDMSLRGAIQQNLRYDGAARSDPGGAAVGGLKMGNSGSSDISQRFKEE